MLIEKIVIVNVFGSSNRGDAALIDVCLSQINAVFPSASISGVAFQPEREKARIGWVKWYERPGRCTCESRLIRRICIIFRQALIYAYVLLGQPQAIGCFLPKAQRGAIGEILSADLVISCPGGYLEDSNPSYLAALTQLWIATRGRGSLIMAHQSIGPVRAQIGRRYLRYILSKCAAICVREGESKAFVDQLLCEPGVATRVGDLAFSLPSVLMRQAVVHQELGLQANRYIAATVVDWTFPLSHNPKVARRRYVEQLAIAIDSIHLATQCPIVIVNQVSTDLQIAAEVVALCRDETQRSIIIDRKDRPLEEVRSLIGGASAFLGSRFHSCIFALLEAVPVLAISYLPKTTGIMSDLGLSHRVVDIYEVDGKAIARRLESLYVSPQWAIEEQRRALDSYIGKFPSLSEVLLAHSNEVGGGRGGSAY